MSDELKKILSNELAELRQNKIRAGALGVCFIILLIFWITDDGSGGEEIILNDEPPLTKDLPVVKIPAQFDNGVKIVLGANADALFIGDPFAVEEKTPPPKSEPPTPPLPKIPDTPILVSSLEEPPLEIPSEQEEKFILTGTAISGENKTAMFLRGEETLFKTVGEEIGGRKISEITPDFVIFEDGTRVEFQKEPE